MSFINERNSFDTSQLSKEQEGKERYKTSLVTGFIGLAHERTTTYLHNKRQKALQGAFIVMEQQLI